jgi:hypothetical protein
VNDYFISILHCKKAAAANEAFDLVFVKANYINPLNCTKLATDEGTDILGDFKFC